MGNHGNLCVSLDTAKPNPLQDASDNEFLNHLGLRPPGCWLVVAGSAVKAESFVLHQGAFDFVYSLRSAERLKIRKALEDLTSDPWQIPTSEIRPPNDRPYQVREVAGFQIVSWLDVWVQEVCNATSRRLATRSLSNAG
jgi:hypothetical protein